MGNKIQYTTDKNGNNIEVIDRTEDMLITFDEPVKTKVVRKMCPVCGKELIAIGPTIYDPYSFEKYALHKCDCTCLTKLDSAYPKVVYVDEHNNEIKAFCE